MKKLITPIMLVSVMMMGFLVTSIAMPIQSVVSYLKCCQDQPKGARCSDAKFKAACYRACQKGCGDPDGLPGKKCRLDCDRYFGNVLTGGTM